MKIQKNQLNPCSLRWRDKKNNPGVGKTTKKNAKLAKTEMNSLK